MYCQNWEDKMCFDTLNIEKNKIYKVCETKSKFDMRYEFAFLHKIPIELNRKWLGTPSGFSGGIWVAYSKINLGIRINTIPTKTRKDLLIDQQTFFSNERIVMYSLDFLTSYSINFKNNFSFEPIIGYSFGSITAISNDDINIPRFQGFYIGSMLNKYFKIEKDEYASIFTSFGYDFADYSAINKELRSGCFNISIGVALKVTHYKKQLTTK